MNHLLASLRITVATLLVCVLGYTTLVLTFAQIVTPHTADGSLLRRADGTIVGSELIAQAFTRPTYFWPRPSAVDHNAAGAGGSNKSPTSADLTQRATRLVNDHGATAAAPLPADLAAASGGGLDPHISEAAARFQAPRVTRARGLDPAVVEALIERLAFAPGGPLTGPRIVNVLQLNLALDSGR